jgi:5,10-methenyltetrahydrofolate synthetase
MDFVEIHNLEKELVEGRFHVHEPKKELPIYRGPIPFVLTPGVEFSWNGGRHGHGKGYYDRFLAKNPQAVKCGVAFSVQVSEKPLTLKPHDVPMNYIVAPKNDPEKEMPHVEKATV